MLLMDEARHSLLFGLSQTLIGQPNVYPEFHLWVVEEAGEPVACAIMTPPFNLVLSQPKTGAAVTALTQALHEEELTLPGVNGAVPEAGAFASEWCRLTGVQAIVEMRLRIHELRAVRHVGEVSGRMREGTPSDRALVLDWILAFTEEAVPSEPGAAGTTERLVDLRLRRDGGGFFLWEDREPVSLAGYGGFTPNGARIGPVYTPPENRGHGYATALTAGVSSWLLNGGRRLCFLYTDLANPTSNRIYRRIGYEPVCDSVRYRFEAT